jgi:RNA polymerase sigma factor (sigma-70 family)
MPLDYDKIMPLVKKVAASTSRYFPAYVLAQDVEGELLLWVYQRKAMIGRAMADDNPEWEAKIAPLMRKVAYDHCNAEKAAAEGYDPSDIYRYSIPKIESLIVDAFDYDDWQSFGLHGDGQPGRKGQANTTGDRITELIDIKTALLKLNDESYNVLIWRYKYGLSVVDMAERQEITPEAAKKRSQRALKGLQKQLGYKEPQELRERPDRRSVRSNSAWNADLNRNYGG